MHVLEIPKIKTSEMLNDELIYWLKFIENPGNEEVQNIMEENKYLKQAKKELAYLSGDPDFQRLVQSRAGFLMDMACYKRQIEKEATEKGILKSKVEIAKKLKEKNISIEDIADITGLSKDEIESL